MADSEKDPIRVVVAMDFSDELMEELKDVSDNLRIERHFPDVPDSVYETAEILYTLRHFPLPEQAPLLRWIQLHSAGLDSLMDKPIVQAEDVEVTSASGIHAVPIAEFSLSMLLAFEYNLLKMVDMKSAGEWIDNRGKIFYPQGLRGKTLGIAGYGSIARELARIADQMGMKVLATKHDAMRTAAENTYIEPGTGDPDGDIPERIYPSEALPSMAGECDYLVITTPLTEATRHMVNEDVFKAMKPTAFLVNISRGAVVDEKALISALAAEEIAGAGLDVFEEEPLPTTSPLWNLDNVILSPHVAGNNTRYHERAAHLFAENLRRYLENRPLMNRLDRERGY
jgi:phosphoglycerate dehydrogenase-like enzyme